MKSSIATPKNQDYIPRYLIQPLPNADARDAYREYAFKIIDALSKPIPGVIGVDDSLGEGPEMLLLALREWVIDSAVTFWFYPFNESFRLPPSEHKSKCCDVLETFTRTGRSYWQVVIFCPPEIEGRWRALIEYRNPEASIAKLGGGVIKAGAKVAT